MPEYKLSAELYHDPNCDDPITSSPKVEAAKETRYADAKALEAEGYEPCPHCLPERAGD